MPCSSKIQYLENNSGRHWRECSFWDHSFRQELLAIDARRHHLPSRTRRFLGWLRAHPHTLLCMPPHCILIRFCLFLWDLTWWHQTALKGFLYLFLPVAAISEICFSLRMDLGIHLSAAINSTGFILSASRVDTTIHQSWRLKI